MSGASAPSVKQQLTAVRMLFDWLIVGQVVPANPAPAVRGPKHVVKTGSTPRGSGRQCAFRGRVSSMTSGISLTPAPCYASMSQAKCDPFARNPPFSRFIREQKARSPR